LSTLPQQRSRAVLTVPDRAAPTRPGADSRSGPAPVSRKRTAPGRFAGDSILSIAARGSPVTSQAGAKTIYGVLTRLQRHSKIRRFEVPRNVWAWSAPTSGGGCTVRFRGAPADTVAILVFGSKGAAGLGVSDGAMKEELGRAAARFSARDFLDFDPAIEPPPVDVPEDCVRCGSYNRRGSRVCSRCKARLKMRSRYDVWSGALIATWDGDHYGVKLGASYADVLKWLPDMRPYHGRESGRNSEFEDIVYAVTHVVYTLNDYSIYSLSPALLAPEFEFLKASLKEAIAIENPDMLGEFMDTLRSFGLAEDDPLIQIGMEYLFSHQNRDGSWGDKRLRDHATWTAIDGLSEYAWRGEGLSFPELKPLLEQWAKAK
jgi:hypothetical protein